MSYTNSKLATYTNLSPNHSGQRNHKIDTITIHCMAGNLSVESCGAWFAKPEIKASSNYGIDSDGKIGLYVEEKNRSWCTSSSSNDNRAITIEVANIEKTEPFRISDAAYKSLIKLLVDICKRNGIKKLLWKADPNLIGQVDKQNMTVHRWFKNKRCPGNWLYNHHFQIAEEVNSKLNMEVTPMIPNPVNPGSNQKLESIKRGEQIYIDLQTYLSSQNVPKWAEKELQEAINLGITDGTNPMQLIPRYQAAIMAKRAIKGK